MIDRVPRQLTGDQRTALHVLGRQVIAQLELRKTAAMLTRSLLDLQAARAAQSSVLVDEPVWQDSGATQRAFLAHVTHDLRTPLNAILGFGQLLAEEGEVPEDERREIAGNINLAGGYMLRLVDDILDVGRLESGTGSFTREEVELESLARATLETLRPLALANGNRVTLSYTSARRTLDGDPTQLQKVLFNLLSNACKYTREGTIRLTIADDGPQRLRVEVADTGIGMSPEQRLRLFRPFAQVHRLQNQQSTGLGLHLTRVLCERMGGAVTVRSEPGVGTTFTVWLPTEPPAATPQGSAIAVAEGDPDVRAALQLALGRTAPLMFIEGVAELLWTLVDRRWRAVILDLSSPGAEEIELLRAVDRMCRESATPLVAAVSHDDPLLPELLPRWPIASDPGALHRLLEVAAASPG